MINTTYLRRDIDIAMGELEHLQACHADTENRRYACEHGEYWIWQGDGEDHPESLTCNVLLRIDQLRPMLEDVKIVELMRTRVANLDSLVARRLQRDLHDAYTAALVGEASALRNVLTPAELQSEEADT